MAITALLVVVFVLFQVVEYKLAQFTITDGVFGSTFYAGTGLHGFHMITLILMLSLVTFRM
jgi:cytochrome c oxidase subunit 3